VLASKRVHQARDERPLRAIGNLRRSASCFDSSIYSLQRVFVVGFFSDLLAKVQPDLSQVRAPTELFANEHRSHIGFRLGVE
jgi:hypothetical protein